jgi:hypothetical protein
MSADRRGQGRPQNVRTPRTFVTGNFQGFAINGEAIELPSQRRNGAWFTAELHFGVGGLGWREVTARTTLRPGLDRSRQDGFGACKVRR